MLETFVVPEFYKGSLIPGLFLAVKTILFIHLYKAIYNETNPRNQVERISKMPRYSLMKQMINTMLVVYLLLDVSSHISGNSVIVEDLVDAGTVQTFVSETTNIADANEITEVKEEFKEGSELVTYEDESSTESLTPSQEFSFVLLSTVLYPVGIIAYIFLPCFFHLFFCRFFFEKGEGNFTDSLMDSYKSFTSAVMTILKEYWKGVLSVSFLISTLTFVMDSAASLILSIITLVMFNVIFIASAFFLAKGK